MFVFQQAIVFSFFSFCENRFLIILTCYRQCVMHVNDEDILLVKAVSQSYCVLYHSLGNIGCALMCPFISLSTVITTDAFLYQLSALLCHTENTAA